MRCAEAVSRQFKGYQVRSSPMEDEQLSQLGVSNVLLLQPSALWSPHTCMENFMSAITTSAIAVHIL